MHLPLAIMIIVVDASQNFHSFTETKNENETVIQAIFTLDETIHTGYRIIC